MVILIRITKEKKIKIKSKLLDILKIGSVIFISGFVTILMLNEVKSAYQENQIIIEKCFEDFEKDVSISIQTEGLLFPDTSCEKISK